MIREAMSEPYNPADIEASAQQNWLDKKCFQVNEDLNKEKFYALAMFPYPSGTLHMGHVRNYTLADVVARYQRMQGKNVLQPIGWDAFGLPAENAAIAHQVHPSVWTDQNIEQMRGQFNRLGFAYDWRRELRTCEPDYYRWQQWFFIQLFKKGLVYKKLSKVNWDPVDQTVLANEQVIDGCGWRSGAPVEQREISQWFLKITAYADELLQDIETLDDWPEQVKTMQRNWIGRSEGTEIYFYIQQATDVARLKTFTTRTDTLMGVEFIAIATDHPLAKQVVANNPEVQAFIERCQHTRVAEADLETMEKEGIDSGLTAKHPITQKPIPIWIANYVLMSYGTGAVMGVPAHDERDFIFATKYHLPITQVIQPDDGTMCDITQHAYVGAGVLINSGEFDGLPASQAIAQISDYLQEHQLGERKVCYRLRDWGLSRQRYWGTPIPMIHCPQCGDVPVADENLPVLLPDNIDTNNNHLSLKQIPEFYHCACPQCGGDAQRETDTFDTFVDSSWYYARFTCKNQNTAMLDGRANYWAPIDYYIGGVEHAVLHLLYARFFYKLMRDENLVNANEPFKKLLTLGMVLNQGEKMSKSKGNVVAPIPLIEKYGADTVRLFIIFAAPPEQSLEWSPHGVEGAFRFLKKLWAFNLNPLNLDAFRDAEQNDIKTVVHWDAATEDQKSYRREIHTILSQAHRDYERSQFNTIVSSGMKLFNIINKLSKGEPNLIDKYIIYEGYTILLRLLAPIAPHITHHLWKNMGYDRFIIDAPWPKVIKDALKEEQMSYVVQVNGKWRGTLSVSANWNSCDIEKSACSQDYVTLYVGNKTLQKAIVITKRKLINLVYT